jgi:hypothetical protein
MTWFLDSRVKQVIYGTRKGDSVYGLGYPWVIHPTDINLRSNGYKSPIPMACTPQMAIQLAAYNQLLEDIEKAYASTTGSTWLISKTTEDGLVKKYLDEFWPEKSPASDQHRTCLNALLEENRKERNEGMIQTKPPLEPKPRLSLTKRRKPPNPPSVILCISKKPKDPVKIKISTQTPMAGVQKRLTQRSLTSPKWQKKSPTSEWNPILIKK